MDDLGAGLLFVVAIFVFLMASLIAIPFFGLWGINKCISKARRTGRRFPYLYAGLIFLIAFGTWVTALISITSLMKVD